MTARSSNRTWRAISHRDEIDDLIQKGRDLEKMVLSRAVRWHIESRILLYANKTVIFD